MPRPSDGGVATAGALNSRRGGGAGTVPAGSITSGPGAGDVVPLFGAERRVEASKTADVAGDAVVDVRRRHPPLPAQTGSGGDAP